MADLIALQPGLGGNSQMVSLPRHHPLPVVEAGNIFTEPHASLITQGGIELCYSNTVRTKGHSLIFNM